MDKYLLEAFETYRLRRATLSALSEIDPSFIQEREILRARLLERIEANHSIVHQLENTRRRLSDETNEYLVLSKTLDDLEKKK